MLHSIEIFTSITLKI